MKSFASRSLSVNCAAVGRHDARIGRHDDNRCYGNCDPVVERVCYATFQDKDPDVCRSKCAVTSMAAQAQGSKPSGSSDTLCCRAAETWLAARYTDLNLHGLANILRGYSV